MIEIKKRENGSSVKIEVNPKKEVASLQSYKYFHKIFEAGAHLTL